MNIGFFGLTANPPHFSHCYAIEEALKVSDKVYISLVYKHPFGKSFIDYAHRLNMFNLIVQDYFKEQDLSRIKILETDKEYYESFNETPYSYNLLQYLQQREPSNQFKLVIGEDNYKPEVWIKFYKHNEIESDFGLIIVPDKGTHSTGIREKMKDPEANRDFLIKSCGLGVFNYMLEKHLY